METQEEQRHEIRAFVNLFTMRATLALAAALGARSADALALPHGGFGIGVTDGYHRSLSRRYAYVAVSPSGFTPPCPRTCHGTGDVTRRGEAAESGGGGARRRAGRGAGARAAALRTGREG